MVLVLVLTDDRCHRQAVETVSECLPELDVVAPLALVVETVYAVDAGTLVIPSQQEKVFRVLNLVSKQKANGLQGLLAAVHVISWNWVWNWNREEKRVVQGSSETE